MSGAPNLLVLLERACPGLLLVVTHQSLLPPHTTHSANNHLAMDNISLPPTPPPPPPLPHPSSPAPTPPTPPPLPPSSSPTLHSANAHPALEDCSGWLPLHYAVDNGHIECVKSLLAYPNYLGLTGLKPALDISRGNDFTEITAVLEQAFQR